MVNIPNDRIRNVEMRDGEVVVTAFVNPEDTWVREVYAWIGRPGQTEDKPE